ncbi:hypothetical protein ABEB36_010249 [Hypothenemus hampei]|uniref:Protein Wnt n=1 Tax=Hypothenemus hampei TaxID=57062 RepID=A0ABD1EIZ9_HYPHA
MKIFSSKLILQFVAVLCFFGLIFGSASIKDLNTTSRSNKILSRRKSLIALLLTTNGSFFDPELESEKHLCRWLKGLKYQRNMCQRKKGLPELLQQTRQLTLHSCQLQFKYEQWNCSSQHMRKIFKKFYRETAFMYSLTTSAMVHVIAKACMEGKLENCKCASHKITDTSKNLGWGGCSVNMKFATRFVEKFLQLKVENESNDFTQHNSLVGLKTIKNKVERYCKCHGLSGSCKHKICIKRIKSFSKITRNLKKLYHNAIKVEPNNNPHDIHRYHNDKQLLFLDSTPSFCDAHKGWSFSTVGRRCKDMDNCATLCCGNSYKAVTRTVHEKCKCYWQNGTELQLNCDTCPKEELHYFCT